METSVGKLEKMIDKLEMSAVYLSSLGVIVMMFLVTADVSRRYLFNRPIRGGMEVTEIIMVIIVFLGISYAQKQKAHVGCDVFYDRIPSEKLKAIIALIQYVISIVISFAMSYYTFMRTIVAHRTGVSSIYMYWPLWPLPLIAAIGFALLGLRLMLDTRDQFLKVKQMKNQL